MLLECTHLPSQQCRPVPRVEHLCVCVCARACVGGLYICVYVYTRTYTPRTHTHTHTYTQAHTHKHTTTVTLKAACHAVPTLSSPPSLHPSSRHSPPHIRIGGKPAAGSDPLLGLGFKIYGLGLRFRVLRFMGSDLGLSLCVCVCLGLREREREGQSV